MVIVRALPLAVVILTGLVVGSGAPILHSVVAPVHAALFAEELTGCAGRHNDVLLSLLDWLNAIVRTIYCFDC